MDELNFITKEMIIATNIKLLEEQINQAELVFTASCQRESTQAQKLANESFGRYLYNLKRQIEAFRCM